MVFLVEPRGRVRARVRARGKAGFGLDARWSSLLSIRVIHSLLVQRWSLFTNHSVLMNQIDASGLSKSKLNIRVECSKP